MQNHSNVYQNADRLCLRDACNYESSDWLFDTILFFVNLPSYCWVSLLIIDQLTGYFVNTSQTLLSGKLSRPLDVKFSIKIY